MKKGRTDRSAEESAGVERLPNAELEVLACLWQKGEATAAQIRVFIRLHPTLVVLTTRESGPGVPCTIATLRGFRIPGRPHFRSKSPNPRPPGGPRVSTGVP